VRALISVYDKTGLVPFARGLADLGFELVSSGGTATALEEAGLQATRVEDVTSFPELLDGRVKTLHPRIHAGILARRDQPEDLAVLEEHGIEPIDLVCVSLYPFERAAFGLRLDEQELLELIDVGGPSLLRAAAKNHHHVTAICRPEDYDEVLAELRERDDGTTSDATRRRLASVVFAVTAAYDSAISRWFQGDEELPETFVPTFDKFLGLAYGENPQQGAAYYAERGRRTHVLSRVEQLAGKPLSFNNVNDLSAGRLLIREFDHPGCVIIKHANPCGVAVAERIEDAYARAVAADPVSAYGGVVVFNHAVTAALGEALAGQFVEVLFAPGYDEQAMEALAAKSSMRILNDTERRALVETERDYRRVLGGLLVQDRDWGLPERERMEVLCGEVSNEQWMDLLFAWRVVKHVTSNAIVLARRGQTLGIGAGQTSRVDAVRLAVDKARALGHDLEGAVLASDAFFPFADGVEVALEAGIAAIIQPGGSKRDDEVAAAVRKARRAMVLTHARHFRH
jgi:phosphoribosylaminoimidazolecarboxamide formyltransferase / IMP cyclohydrolase